MAYSRPNESNKTPIEEQKQQPPSTELLPDYQSNLNTSLLIKLMRAMVDNKSEIVENILDTSPKRSQELLNGLKIILARSGEEKNSIVNYIARAVNLSEMLKRIENIKIIYDSSNPILISPTRGSMCFTFNSEKIFQSHVKHFLSLDQEKSRVKFLIVLRILENPNKENLELKAKSPDLYRLCEHIRESMFNMLKLPSKVLNTSHVIYLFQHYQQSDFIKEQIAMNIKLMNPKTWQECDQIFNKVMELLESSQKKQIREDRRQLKKDHDVLREFYKSLNKYLKELESLPKRDEYNKRKLILISSHINQVHEHLSAIYKLIKMASSLCEQKLDTGTNQTFIAFEKGKLFYKSNTPLSLIAELKESYNKLEKPRKVKDQKHSRFSDGKIEKIERNVTTHEIHSIFIRSRNHHERKDHQRDQERLKLKHKLVLNLIRERDEMLKMRFKSKDEAQKQKWLKRLDTAIKRNEMEIKRNEMEMERNAMRYNKDKAKVQEWLKCSGLFEVIPEKKPNPVGEESMPSTTPVKAKK